MAALNYNSREPFITYITLFQSRIAAANLVLRATTAASQTSVQLDRRLSAVLQEKVQVEPSSCQAILSYLALKKFIGDKESPKARYPGLSMRRTEDSFHLFDRTGREVDRFEAFRIDVWMADERIPSVTGVPTPSNVSEIVELSNALRVISKQAISWTSAGEAITKVRELYGRDENPFLLGPELLILLRQLVERDGLMLAALTAHLVRAGRVSVKRDDVAISLPELARDALTFAKERGNSADSLRLGKEFLQTVLDTSKRRAQMSSAPGLLEHRITPRLEWLTDLGVLSKNGLPKNGFEYALADDAVTFEHALARWLQNEETSDDVALRFWQASHRFSQMRRIATVTNPREALLRAYAALKRTIGPLAIRDVCLVAGMTARDYSVRISTLEAELLEMARHEKRITLSGGRYQRGAEFVYIDDGLLKEAAP